MRLLVIQLERTSRLRSGNRKACPVSNAVSQAIELDIIRAAAGFAAGRVLLARRGGCPPLAACPLSRPQGVPDGPGARQSPPGILRQSPPAAAVHARAGALPSSPRRPDLPFPRLQHRLP